VSQVSLLLKMQALCHGIIGAPRGASRLHAKGMDVLYARQLEQPSGLAQRLCVARSVEERA
jgi:hypothetical protein